MKKFFKLISIVCTVLVILFLVYCFLPEDEYNDDYSYENNYSSNDYNNEYNNQTTGVSTSTSISSELTAAKEELIAQGLIRTPQVTLKGNGEDTVTILIYMNGSDLESNYSEATTDISEMVKAGSSDKVNIIMQTMGTKKWDSKYGISADHSERYKINGNGLTLIDGSLSQLDCTKSSTLTDFIKWGVSNYPADRYILQFWNHGGGPVYGFGYDEWNEDEYACLSADEIKTGLKDSGVYFDFIGMDCCIMSCLELGCALYDYCDYLITSEDFESGLGWSYTEWMSALIANSSISTPELGKIICDSMVESNEKDSYSGDDSIMAVVDLSMMKILYASWEDFAYANKATLLGTNYSEKISRKRGGRILPSMNRNNENRNNENSNHKDFWDSSDEDYQLSDYYVTDIMAVAQNIDSPESKALSAAVSETLIYVRASSGDSGLTGLSVTLPYGDVAFYTELNTVFTNIGLSSEYINWLKDFTTVASTTSSYDYDDWYDSWDGWDYYDDEYDWSDWDYYDDEYWDDEYYWDDYYWDDDFWFNW